MTIPCCIHCRGTIPNPKITKPEIVEADLNHVTARMWVYFKCPSCKKEWSDIQILEVVTENGTALTSLPQLYKAHGYDPSTLPQVRDPKLSKDARGILQELLREASGRVTYLPEQGKGNSSKVPQVRGKVGNL